MLFKLSARALPIARPTPFLSRRFLATMENAPAYENIIVDTPRPGVGLVTLNRPKALNALNSPLFKELNAALSNFQSDASIGAIVITGSNRAFAAGADIKEMASKTFSEAYNADFLATWSQLTTITKPIIAAVNGFALGGGCELALMTDIIYAGPKAVFGQPEIKLGVIPGAGGSQRLTKLVGKSRAMEAVLTGRNIDVEEAEKWGITAKRFDTPEGCVEGALDTAELIAGYSKIAVKAAKEVVNVSEETSLAEGVRFERRVFHGLFATQDQKIGMKAFVEKVKPEWKHE